MKNVDSENAITEWKKYTITLGRHVRIVTQQEESEGLAVDVDETGALVLELANGEQKKIIYGDCFLV
jgi:BirA family biotin operon repressor/biotin-[acetyl-CoA-carboxylase] ligase